MIKKFLIITVFSCLTACLYANEQNLKLSSEGYIDAGFDYHITDEKNTNEFFLKRAELSFKASYLSYFGGKITFEAVRSGTAASNSGIDGNSILLRVKNAYGFLNKDFSFVNIEAKAGIIPEPYIASIESIYEYDGLKKSFAEKSEIYVTSDAGVSAAVSFFDKRISLTLMLSNGEGYNEIERNNGKNLSLMISSIPLKTENNLIMLSGNYRNGSIGFDSAKNSAFSGMIGWKMRTYNINTGIEYSMADGFGGISERKIHALGIWAGGDIWKDCIGIFSRYDSILDDSAWHNAGMKEITAAFYVDIMKIEESILRLYLSYSKIDAEENYGTLPGGGNIFDEDRISVNLSFGFDYKFN